jgi:hypothetical protein
MTGLPSMNRRAVLASSIVTALMVAGSGFAAFGPNSNDTFYAILRRLIGPFQMPDQEFGQFVEDFQAASMQLGSLENGAVWIAEKLGGVQPSIHVGVAGTNKLKSLERVLLTEFALATGIAADPANRQSMRYSGLFAAHSCSNPFARFD